MANDQDAGSSDPDPRENLAAAMSRLARHLQEEHGDVAATLKAITSAAVGGVPNTEECGISYVIGRRTIEQRAASSDLPKSIDALQERLGQGPCLDAVWNEQIVQVDDLAAEER